MKISELRVSIASKPKWNAVWLLINSVLCGFTMILLIRWGYLSFDELTGFLLGFFVPLVLFSIKGVMGLYKYPENYTQYHISERTLEEAIIHYNNNKWAEALIILDKIDSYLPSHKRVLYYSARCNEELGNHELASSQYREYLVLQPDDSEVCDALSRIESSLLN